MIAHRVTARDVGSRHAGMVAAHSIRDAPGAKFLLRKGQIVGVDDLSQLRELDNRELHLVEPETGELHEDEAGRRLARSVAGSGVRLRGPAESQYTLLAEGRGLLRIDEAALFEVNNLDGVSVLTRFDYQPVDEGDELAGAKVTPLVLPQATVLHVEQICAARPPLRVVPFRPGRVSGLILERVASKVRERFRTALERKLAWYGSELVMLLETDGERSYADLLRSALAIGPDLVLAAGASSLDPLEPLFAALDSVGARIVKHGVPVHPGSLFWTAAAGNVPLFGLSSCEMFSEKTVLDLVLPRVFAGERVGRAELARLGHGGMLGREMAFRFPAYAAGDPRGRGN